MELTFVNVGYGEAMVLTCPSPHHPHGIFVMVIDGGTGNPAEYSEPGRIPLHTYFQQANLTHIDVLVNTHIHEDHICGVLPLAEAFPVGAFWQTMPPTLYQSLHAVSLDGCDNHSVFLAVHALEGYRTLCHTFAQRNVPIVQLQPGMAMDLPEGLTMDILAPDTQKAARFAQAYATAMAQGDAPATWKALSAFDGAVNNASLVLQFTYGGRTILLPGDTNGQGYGNIPLQAVDIFKVGHHCQADGIAPQQLSVLRPKLAVCTGSSDRRYNSVAPQVLDMVTQQGGHWYYTDCPQDVPHAPPVHSALTFAISPDGVISPRYHYK